MKKSMLGPILRLTERRLRKLPKLGPRRNQSKSAWREIDRETPKDSIGGILRRHCHVCAEIRRKPGRIGVQGGLW